MSAAARQSFTAKLAALPLSVKMTVSLLAIALAAFLGLTNLGD